MAGVIGRQVDGRGRNEAVVFDPAGREIARYTKLNPFSLGGETKHYVRGDDVEVISRVPGNWRRWSATTCDFRRFFAAWLRNRRESDGGYRQLARRADRPLDRPVGRAGDRESGLRRGPEPHGTRSAPGLFGPQRRFRSARPGGCAVGRPAGTDHGPARSGRAGEVSPGLSGAGRSAAGVSAPSCRRRRGADGRRSLLGGSAQRT